MVSQNILNLVDLAMVGSQGEAAVAAVGVGSFANFLAMAFITGISPGVQAMCSRRQGAGRTSETALPLNGALLIALGVGIPGSILLYQLVPWVFPFLNPDPAVVEVGVPYLQARLVALAAVGMNFSFRGYWNGVSKSNLYMRTLLVMHAANIFLNWVLIFGNLGAPEMGAPGAGVASAISTWIGTAFYFWLGFRHAREGGFLKGLPSRETIRSVLRLGVPGGLQQLSFAAGYNVLFWIIGHIGYFDPHDAGHATTEVAAANAVLNLMLVGMLPGMALGLAAASLVGQALGRGDPDDAFRWAWQVVGVAVVVLTVIGVPMWLVPDALLSIFLHEAEPLDVARWPLRLAGMFLAFDAITAVLMSSLQGAGAVRTAMLVSVSLQWLIFLPIAFVLGPVLGYGLLVIWSSQIAHRGLSALTFAVLWMRRGWVHAEAL